MRGDPVPRRPFRDSAIMYAVMAGAVVVVGLVTGNRLAESLLIAAAFFLVATSYSWWRFRRRLEREGRR